MKHCLFILLVMGGGWSFVQTFGGFFTQPVDKSVISVTGTQMSSSHAILSKN